MSYLTFKLAKFCNDTVSEKVGIPPPMLKSRVDVPALSRWAQVRGTSIILITFRIACSRLVSTGGDKWHR